MFLQKQVSLFKRHVIGKYADYQERGQGTWAIPIFIRGWNAFQILPLHILRALKLFRTINCNHQSQ